MVRSPRVLLPSSPSRVSGFLLFGYDQGVMSGIVSAPQFFRIFPDLNPANVGKNQASVMQAFYTAIYEVGCLAGAIFALLFGNKLGRRKNIMAGGFWVIIGTIIQITCIPGYVPSLVFAVEPSLTSPLATSLATSSSSVVSSLASATVLTPRRSRHGRQSAPSRTTVACTSVSRPP